MKLYLIEWIIINMYLLKTYRGLTWVFTQIVLQIILKILTF